LNHFDRLPRVSWRDVDGVPQTAAVSAGEEGKEVVLRARNRLAIAEGVNGSIAVFPPPHQFFFPRELEVNLGYVWYRQDAGNSLAIGVRHADHEEGYNPAWIKGVFPLYNAPPGTWQRSEEHTSELQSLRHLVCRLLLEKKKLSPEPISSRFPEKYSAHVRSNETRVEGRVAGNRTPRECPARIH